MKRWKRPARIALAVVLAAALAAALWLTLRPRQTAPAGESACTLAIRCDAVLNDLDSLAADKRELIPADGVLLPETQAAFADGETAFDLGWLYHVNGQSPDVTCSDYQLQPGDKVEFLYSCDWGQDLD